MIEANCWIDPTVTLPPEDKKVLVRTDKGLTFCGNFQRITGYEPEGAPEDELWLESPGWEHELKVAYWRMLPDLPAV